MVLFNSYIDELELMDIPLVWKQFIWYQTLGHSKSQLDKFLVCNKWMKVWPISTQYLMKRSFSDHCPLILKNSIVDWEPKLFRVLNFWFMESGFMEDVGKWWESFELHGRVAFVLKEKNEATEKENKKNAVLRGLVNQCKDMVDKINYFGFEG